MRVKIGKEMFQALPFRLASSPRIFTKVLAEALAPLRMMAVTVIPYLDNLLFITSSSQQLEMDLQKSHTVSRLANQQRPSQEVVYLSYIIFSIEKKILLQEEKIQRMDQAVAPLQANQEVSIREVMRVIGLMTSCFPWAIFHQRRLQKLLHRYWNSSQEMLGLPIRLKTRVKRSLWWWQAHRNLPRDLLWIRPRSLILTTIASALGWGAHLGNNLGQGVWTPEEARLASNQRELLAI